MTHKHILHLWNVRSVMAENRLISMAGGDTPDPAAQQEFQKNESKDSSKKKEAPDYDEYRSGEDVDLHESAKRKADHLLKVVDKLTGKLKEAGKEVKDYPQVRTLHEEMDKNVKEVNGKLRANADRYESLARDVEKVIEKLEQDLAEAGKKPKKTYAEQIHNHWSTKYENAQRIDASMAGDGGEGTFYAIDLPDKWDITGLQNARSKDISGSRTRYVVGKEDIGSTVDLKIVGKDGTYNVKATVAASDDTGNIHLVWEKPAKVENTAKAPEQKQWNEQSATQALMEALVQNSEKGTANNQNADLKGISSWARSLDPIQRGKFLQDLDRKVRTNNLPWRVEDDNGSLKIRKIVPTTEAQDVSPKTSTEQVKPEVETQSQVSPDVTKNESTKKPEIPESNKVSPEVTALLEGFDYEKSSPFEKKIAMAKLQMAGIDVSRGEESVLKNKELRETKGSPFEKGISRIAGAFSFIMAYAEQLGIKMPKNIEEAKNAKPKDAKPEGMDRYQNEHNELMDKTIASKEKHQKNPGDLSITDEYTKALDAEGKYIVNNKTRLFKTGEEGRRYVDRAKEIYAEQKSLTEELQEQLKKQTQNQDKDLQELTKVEATSNTADDKARGRIENVQSQATVLEAKKRETTKPDNTILEAKKSDANDTILEAKKPDLGTILEAKKPEPTPKMTILEAKKPEAVNPNNTILEARKPGPNDTILEAKKPEPAPQMTILEARKAEPTPQMTILQARKPEGTPDANAQWNSKGLEFAYRLVGSDQASEQTINTNAKILLSNADLVKTVRATDLGNLNKAIEARLQKGDLKDETKKIMEDLKKALEGKKVE